MPVVPGLEERLRHRTTWLVDRPHPWRRQPWIKGRRVTAGDFARTVEIEGWTPERAAQEYGLPVEAVLEAMGYLATHRELVIAEERENALAAQRVDARRRLRVLVDEDLASRELLRRLEAILPGNVMQAPLVRPMPRSGVWRKHKVHWS